MTDATPPTERRDKSSKHSFRLFRYFIVSSIGAMAAILLLTGLGLRAILIAYALEDAERHASDITAAIRDLVADALIHTGPEAHA